MKPHIIEAVYTVAIHYTTSEVEEALGISWHNVEEYAVKWGVLHLTMKCGTALEFDKSEELDEFCWKRPYETNELDSSFKELSPDSTIIDTTTKE